MNKSQIQWNGLLKRASFAMLLIAFLPASHACNKKTAEVSRFQPDSGNISAENKTPPADCMSIYLEEEKIGWLKNSMIESQGGWKIVQSGNVGIIVQGQKRNIVTSGTTITDRSFLTMSFSMKITSEGSLINVDGRAHANDVVVYVDTGKDNKRLFFPLKTDFVTDLNIDRYIVAKKMEKGEKIELEMFEPELLAVVLVKVEFEGVKNIEIDGNEVQALGYTKIIGGAKFNTFVDSRGMILKEEGPLGITIIADKGNCDKGVLSGTRDLIELASIKAERSIHDPEGITFLKVGLSGIDHKNYNMESGRQTYSNGILEIKKERPARNGGKLADTAKSIKSVYLKPAALMESDSPDIRNLAKSVVGDEQTVIGAVGRINSYLFSKIKKTNIIGSSDAIETMKRMEGDCTEHAYLFVAMARSLGIPARVIAGVAYRNGRFYYHAWAEVYDLGWISVDPTWGQLPADATHIKFVEGNGDEFAKIMGLIGNLKIQVLDWK